MATPPANEAAALRSLKAAHATGERERDAAASYSSANDRDDSVRAEYVCSVRASEQLAEDEHLRDD